MAQYHRRSFLRRASLGIAALATFLYPDLPAVARTFRASVVADASSPVALDPTYAGGVASMTSAANQFLLTSAAGSRVVTIPAGAEVWKETTGASNLIEVGDWVDVKGTPQPDGALLATSGMIFVNIARMDGVVRTVGSGTMQVMAYGEVRTVELSKYVEVVSAADESDIVGGAPAIRADTAFGAVGLKLPGGGFRATRIWI